MLALSAARYLCTGYPTVQYNLIRDSIVTVLRLVQRGVGGGGVLDRL